MKYQQGNEFINDSTLYIITSVTETEVEFLSLNSWKRFTKMTIEEFDECYKHCFSETVLVLADIKITEYTPSTYNIEDLF